MLCRSVRAPSQSPCLFSGKSRGFCRTRGDHTQQTNYDRFHISPFLFPADWRASAKRLGLYALESRAENMRNSYELLQHPDIVFANDGEERQQIGHPQKLPDPRAQIHQLQFTARRPRRNQQTDQRAQAHAVHLNQIGQIEHDSPAARNQWADPGMEQVGFACHQSAAALHNRGLRRALDPDREGHRGCFV